MKNLFLGVICLLIISSYSFGQSTQATEKAKVNGPIITWEKSTHEFGDIFQGDKVEHKYAFTNTGNEPLIITNVQVTCGCTVPNYPKDPIAPGGKGEITIGFNSAGKSNMQNKVIKIVSNAVGDNNQISFTANVLEKKQPQ